MIGPPDTGFFTHTGRLLPAIILVEIIEARGVYCPHSSLDFTVLSHICKYIIFLFWFLNLSFVPTYWKYERK